MRWVGMIETQYDLTHTTTPSGRQSTNGKIKPQLNPRGCAAKEEDLKSLLQAGCKNKRFTPPNQLCRHGTYRTSKHIQ